MKDTLDKGFKLYLIEKEKREKEAREHASRFAAAVGAQSEKKRTDVLEGRLSSSLTTIEYVLEKGVELKRKFEKLGFELQFKTNLTKVNPKRLKSVAVSEEAQLAEA